MVEVGESGLLLNWTFICKSMNLNKYRMKHWIGMSLLALLFQQNAQAQSKVIADVSNFENNKGVCRACLFNSASSFKGESGSPVQCVEVSIAGNRSQVQFDNIPAGTYAIFLFHDTNKNNKMDKNFMGIPKEGYGASQNKLPFASAPTYNENKFSVGSGATVRLSIKLRNL